MNAMDKIFSDWNCSDEPGYVVGIAHKDRLLYRRAFGLASLELGVANTTATRMRIGSTTKQFACLAAFLLQESGQLDVDASARTYLPELPKTTVEPTLRQLMNHTGGYRDYLDLNLLAQGLALPRPGSMLASAIRQRGINFAPGERMIYNNGGYHLLSLVIERVGGMPFGDFLKTHIFDPLGMIDTACVPDDLTIHPRVAPCHVPMPAGGYRRGVFPSRELLGEGAMISTTDDMLRWLKHLRGEKRVGNAQTWRQMTKRTGFEGGGAGEYACGLIIGTYRGTEVIHHSGGLVGGAAQMLTVPEHGLDIIFMTNGAHTVDPMKICKDIIDEVLGDGLPAAVEKSADAAQFTGLEGIYASDVTKDVFDVVAQEGKLFLREMGVAPKPLFARGGLLEMEASVFGPTTLDYANLPSLEITQCGKPMQLTRVEGPAPAVADIAERVLGEFESADLAARATIAFDGTEITLDMQGLDGRTRYTLEALTSAIFRFVPADPYGMQTGFIVADASDERVNHFWLGTLASRRIEFVRAPAPVARVRSTEGVIPA